LICSATAKTCSLGADDDGGVDFGRSAGLTKEELPKPIVVGEQEQGPVEFVCAQGVHRLSRLFRLSGVSNASFEEGEKLADAPFPEVLIGTGDGRGEIIKLLRFFPIGVLR